MQTLISRIPVGTTTTGSDKHLSADGDDTTVAPAAASTADASASTPTKESSISRGGRMSVAKRAGLYMQTAGGSFKQRESDEKAKKVSVCGWQTMLNGTFYTGNQQYNDPLSEKHHPCHTWSYIMPIITAYSSTVAYTEPYMWGTDFAKRDLAQ